jgi:hypothetical protein
MNKAWIILITFLLISSLGEDGSAQSSQDSAGDTYHWLAGQLIPNEFGLPDGTWSGLTLNECISKCSADRNCRGFSVEKKFGDAWESGCEGTLCGQQTECHAKGGFGSSDLWLPDDDEIRVPGVDAKSNSWIQSWGTLLKN